MKGKLGVKARLQHILDAINVIDSYIEKAGFNDFLNNSMMRFACLKQIEIIGEAGNSITKDTRAKFSDVEWRQIVGMRNVIVHEYFGVDNNLVWEVIKNDLPELKEKVEEILNHL